MKQNGDSDAAAAMSRVTGLSLVDNQYVFVRGLGERYSNTTLAGSVLPTTEPDKKVVPLDLFPTGLIDSVQVNKSYSPDRSAEFAGGLVQIVPMKLPNQPVLDFSYGVSYYSTATGKSIPLSPLGNRDCLGLRQRRARAAGGHSRQQDRAPGHLHAGRRLHRRTRSRDFGRLLGNQWRPVNDRRRARARTGARRSATASASSASSPASRTPTRSSSSKRIARSSASATARRARSTSDYHIQTGTQKAQLGVVGNLAYQFTPSQRLAFENFYTHSGRDEGRFFQGTNLDNAREYQNNRLQFIEEGLMSNAIGGEHFFAALATAGSTGA